MLFKVCLLLLTVHLLGNRQVASLPAIKLTLTTNLTSLPVGKAFNAKCLLLHYDPIGNEQLAFRFYRTNKTHNERLVDYSFDVSDTGRRQWSLAYNSRDHGDLAILLHNTTRFPVCEVTFIPRSLNEYEYYCAFHSSTSDYHYSNNVNVSAYKPIEATFTSNVSALVANQPFTGSCHLRNVQKAYIQNYSVEFLSSSGPLAAYHVFALNSAAKEPFIVFESFKRASISVGRGEYSAIDSTFQVVLNDNAALDTVYWCRLVDGTSQLQYASNTWPAAAVTFNGSVSAHQNGRPFTGRCSIAHFIPNSSLYSVGFFASQSGLLATYVARPNEPLELVVEQQQQQNVTVSLGASLKLPVYELTINLTGPRQAFWCALHVGEHADSVEYKSNELKL